MKKVIFITWISSFLLIISFLIYSCQKDELKILCKKHDFRCELVGLYQCNLKAYDVNCIRFGAGTLIKDTNMIFELRALNDSELTIDAYSLMYPKNIHALDTVIYNSMFSNGNYRDFYDKSNGYARYTTLVIIGDTLFSASGDYCNTTTILKYHYNIKGNKLL